VAGWQRKDLFPMLKPLQHLQR